MDKCSQKNKTNSRGHQIKITNQIKSQGPRRSTAPLKKKKESKYVILQIVNSIDHHVWQFYM